MIRKIGFSLAEMMIVMLMVSIVLAAATPIITKRVIASSNSGGDSSLPSGVIVIWKGSAATIPDGWQLCDGTNGTPDLRSRFVYGAGGDTNTKATMVSGWNTAANGHWAIGYAGGEEQHLLSVSEIPPLSFSIIRTTNTRDDGEFANRGNFVDIMIGDRGAEWSSVNTYGTPWITTNAGGQPHNIFPRFYCLAYIMKL